jgi:hypothetical protein
MRIIRLSAQSSRCETSRFLLISSRCESSRHKKGLRPPRLRRTSGGKANANHQAFCSKQPMRIITLSAHKQPMRIITS